MEPDRTTGSHVCFCLSCAAFSWMTPKAILRMRQLIPIGIEVFEWSLHKWI